MHTLSTSYPNQKIHFIQTDVRHNENIRESFREAVELFKFIDIVVANAGISNESEFENTIQINLVSSLHYFPNKLIVHFFFLYLN